jgi:hypothetical protein
MAATWAAAAIWIIPWLIGQAYHGRSAAFLNSMIRGQQRHPVEHYLGLWKSLALTTTVALTAFAILLAWLVPASGRLRQRFRERPSSPLPALGATGLVSTVAVAGVFGGLAEAAQKIIRDRIAHEPSGDITSGVAFWMGPLAAFALLGVIVIILFVIERATRGRVPATRFAPVMTWTVVFFGLLTVLKLGFAWYATWILAIGLATLVARAISVSIPEFTRLAPRALAPVVVALGAWGIAVPIMRTSKSSQAERALPSAAPG